MAGKRIPSGNPAADSARGSRRFPRKSLLAAALLTGSVSTPAAASDWGCEVLLCLASPGSPTQYAACVAPITRLWRHLAALRPFPRCAFAGPGDVSLGIDLWESCPPGTVEVRRRLQAEFVGQGIQPRRCAQPRTLNCLANRHRYWNPPDWCSESAIFQARWREEPCWIQVRIRQADGTWYTRRHWYRASRCAV